MAIAADNFQILHDYAEGVMKRAEHHAGNVGAIALALLGGIIWRAKPGSVSIMQRDGSLANVLWWDSVEGNKYACSYNHETDEIELRAKSVRGPVLHSFSNATVMDDLRSKFSKL